VSLFLTGTDTGVGKTFVAVQLLRLLRAAGVASVGMKPICCGDREDARQLLAASTEGTTLDEINPVWLQSPAAPSVAAEIEHVEIDLAKIDQHFRVLAERFEVVIVEGVGGWLVPITSDLFVSDLAKRLDLPVVIIAENRLGCLNHTLLTVNSVRNRGVAVAAVVLNEAGATADLAQSTNEGELRRLLPDTLLIPLKQNGEELRANLAQLFSGKAQKGVFNKLTQL